MEVRNWRKVAKTTATEARNFGNIFRVVYGALPKKDLDPFRKWLEISGFHSAGG
jgi:hypothetical protein